MVLELKEFDAGGIQGGSSDAHSITVVLLLFSFALGEGNRLLGPLWDRTQLGIY